MNLEERYDWACTNNSDIADHVPTLMQIGRKCRRITEFGVRGGVSTSAWLMAKPESLICYDRIAYDCLDELKRIASEQGIHFQFHLADTTTVTIEETDLLFLDTLHTAEQVRLELTNHVKVSTYIILHDTVSCGEIGEDGGRGITFPMLDFLSKNPNWTMAANYIQNNGLVILKKI